jgi:hypothetical protein
MKTITLINTIALSTLLCGYSAFSHERLDAEKLERGAWIESCPNNDFCFSHPKNFKRIPIQAIDSNAGQFENNHMALSFDLGWYASRFSELTKASKELIVIDNRKGVILLQDEKIALSVPKVEGLISFSMLLTFNHDVDIKQAKRIFSSIRFNIEPISH